MKPPPTFEPPVKRHATLVGIDSDGCVFDSVPVKFHNHFVPVIMRLWGLEEVETLVRRHIDRVNRFSATRGGNRFPNLVLLFEGLATEPEIHKRGLKMPDLSALRHFCASGLALSEERLAVAVARSQDPELQRVLDWSRAVSHDIDTNMEPVPPFKWARRSLERMALASDLVVISQTPEAAIRSEWHKHGIDKLVPSVAGQERGNKTLQLERANSGRYAAGKRLMIGDAPGDHRAAEASGALFYPILPGREEESWQQFHDEAYPRFIAGTFAGTFADDCLQRFKALLNMP